LTAICAIDPQATAIVSPEGKNPVIETLSKVAFDASLSLPLDLRRQALTALAKTGKQEAAGRLANVLNTSTNTQLILDAASGAIIFLGNADENMLKDALVNALFVKLFSTSDLIQVGPNEFARYMQIRAEALNLLTRADIDQRLKVLISDREASADYSAVNALRALQQALINPQLDARLSAYLDKACASSAPQAERIAALDAMAKESAATANPRAVLHLINIINEGAASDSVLLGAAIRALAKIDPKATALLYPSGQNPLLDTFGRIAGNNSFPDGLRREASRALVLTGQQQAGRVLANALMGKDPLFVLSVVNDIRSLLAREP
jgi:hypothetical protein